MRGIDRIISGALVAMILTGCAVGPQRSFREFTTADETSVATDASHRVILSQKPQMSPFVRVVDPSIIVCAEPSPDVATAVASSIGTSLSVLGYGSATLGAAEAQSLMQLAERTASIQLLRDQMYRTCESYANGAINGTNYTLIMNRMTETMVTLMLGETAGGRFGASLGSISSKSSADLVAKLSQLAPTIADFQKQTDSLAQANLAVSKAELDLKTAQAAPVPEDAAAKAEHEKGIQKAKDDLKAAEAKRDAILQTMKASADASAKLAAEATATAGGGITAQPSPELAGQLYRMQREFVRRDPSQALVDACLVEMSAGTSLSTENKNLNKTLVDTLGSLKFPETLDAESASGLFKILPMLSTSDLRKFCSHNLRDLTVTFHKSRADLLRAELDIDVNSSAAAAATAKANAAAELAKAYATCTAIEDKTAKAACYATMSDWRSPAPPKQPKKKADQ